MATSGRKFTAEYPDSDYKPTLDSNHPQSKFWPDYLPVQDDRLFIFERSKNAQLVVYTCNFLNKEEHDLRVVDPDRPLDINWQSFGWTDAPTSNATGAIERLLAWGYKHEKIDNDPNNSDCPSEARGKSCDGIKYQISLNAMPQRTGCFYFTEEEGKPVLETTIGGRAAFLHKIFVQTSNSHLFVPTVEYVEIFGIDSKTGGDAYEKYRP